MKKGLKIILFILIILIVIVLLDTIQAKIFKQSPIISWKETLDGDSYVDKGIIINTYYCVKEQDIVTVSSHLKNSKYTCPVYEDNIKTQTEPSETELKYTEKFELVFEKNTDNIKLIYEDTSGNTDYNVYSYGGTVSVIIDNKTYSLEDALKSNKITVEEIIEKANEDILNPKVANDGSSIEYHYESYTIIKLHTMDGNRGVYIGDKNLTLDDLNI